MPAGVKGTVKGQQKTGGRKRGQLNKYTRDIKEMILGALNAKPGGGQAYLERQADENPVAFMGLVGKVLPMTVAGDGSSPLRIIVATGVDRTDD